MIKTSAIRTVNSDPFSIIWDTGRRCNYDCTYCEATRHNLHSPHKTLDEFKVTLDFINKWTSLYNSKRKKSIRTNINFTGGEPTVNPNFWKLIEYIKQQPEEYDLGLTTNGAWDIKNSQKIIDNFIGVTVSYHAEAAPVLKERAIKNILTLAESNIWLQVNVMLHADYWDETVSVYNMLKSKGIKCNPRPIGDGGIVRKGWFVDSDGTNRRTSHEYTTEQQRWFWEEMGVKSPPASVAEGNQLGRACCGSRSLEGKVDNIWQPIKLVNTEFKNWYCMVDWYFLYIDQETGNIYHHQTCKATHDGAPGSIGTIDQSDKLITELEGRLENPQPIICPNQRCGCGMCIPKAEKIEDFNIIKESLIA